MVDSYEERKRRAKIELIKRRYRERQAPKVNKDIKIRQGTKKKGTKKTIDVNKRMKWKETKFTYRNGDVPITVEDIHKEMSDSYEFWKEEESSFRTWEDFFEEDVGTSTYVGSYNNPPLTDIQKQFGRRAIPYEEARAFGATLSEEEYNQNPWYDCGGEVRLPEKPNSAEQYNISLHWENDKNLSAIADEISDVLDININDFYQDMIGTGVGEVQGINLRKLIPAFIADDEYLYDGHSEYYQELLTRLQTHNWSDIGRMWANIFEGRDISRYDVDELMMLSNEVQRFMDKMPGFEANTVLIRYGSLLNESDLEVGDISSFAGFAFSAYNAHNNFQGYQQGQHTDSKRYKLTILAPKGTKGISGGIQIYMDMRFKDNTSTGEVIHNLNQKFIVLSIDKVAREALILLIDDGMATKWMYR